MVVYVCLLAVDSVELELSMLAIIVALRISTLTSYNMNEYRYYRTECTDSRPLMAIPWHRFFFRRPA